MQWVLFAVILLLAGTVFASTIFSDFGDQAKSISSLMLPATALEKFLVGWIYSFLIFIVVYTLLFFGVLFILMELRQVQGYQNMPFGRPIGIDLLLTIFSFLHAVALYGAVVFNKLHFIRTAFCFFVGYGLLILFNTIYLGAITRANALAAIPFAPFTFTINNSLYSIHLLFSDTRLFFFLMIAVTVLIWAAAYLRLKEKQA